MSYTGGMLDTFPRRIAVAAAVVVVSLVAHVGIDEGGPMVFRAVGYGLIAWVAYEAGYRDGAGRESDRALFGDIWQAVQVILLMFVLLGSLAWCGGYPQ